MAISNVDIQSGAVFRGHRGSDRKIVSRDGDLVEYVRRATNGEWGTVARKVNITTLLHWIKEKLDG